MPAAAKRKTPLKRTSGPSAASLLTYGLKPIDKLRPDPRNARHHSDDQIAAISRSIVKFGMTVPILATAKGVIVAGEGRWRAARLLKIAEVPVLTAPKSWSAAETKAYAIADNQLTDSSEWNAEVLREELRALAGDGFDMSAIGIAAGELEQLLLEAAENAAKVWSGMPEYEHEDKQAFRTIVVHFKDAQAVDDFAAKLGMPISDKAHYLWFPELVITTRADKRYVGTRK